jgi:hypothetical protein
MSEFENLMTQLDLILRVQSIISYLENSMVGDSISLREAERSLCIADILLEALELEKERELDIQKLSGKEIENIKNM